MLRLIRRGPRDLIPLLCCACLWQQPRPLEAQNRPDAQARVDMHADRTRVAVGDTFVLRVRVEVQNGSAERIKLPSLEDFDVLSRQTSQPMQFSLSFGLGQGRHIQRSSTTQHTFLLRARRAGRFALDAVRATVGGKEFKSRPVVIEVRAGPGAVPPAAPRKPAPGPSTPGGPQQPRPPLVGRTPNQPPTGGQVDGAQIDPHAFLRTVVDKAEAYVGEQVTVTIYLYTFRPLNSAPTIETEPSVNGFWVHDLLGPNHALQPYGQRVGGRRYHAYVFRRFAAFPLRSGELTIGPMSLRIDQSSLFDLFAQRGPSPVLSRAGVPVIVRVKDLPPAPAKTSPVAVGRFDLKAKLDRNQVPTGDAVKLRVTLRGRGNIKSVTLKVPKLDGLRVLAPQIRDQVSAQNDTVGGTRSFEWLVVPERPGKFTFPPLALNVFDPAKGRYSRVASKPLELLAAGKTLTPAQPGPLVEEVREQAEAAAQATFGPLRTHSALRRDRSRLLDAWWLAWLLALPPLTWLGVIAQRLVLRSQLRSLQRSEPERRLKQAKERLQQAAERARQGQTGAFHTEVAQGLKDAVEARLGEAVGGLTLPELSARLAVRGMSSELATRLVRELEQSEFARYGSKVTTSQEVEQCLQRSQGLLKQLEAFRPSPAQEGR